MWFLGFLFGCSTLLLCWTLFGYFLLIRCMGLFGKLPRPGIPATLPRITVIVPCFNEAADIESKIRNLKELEYPTDLIEVLFIDGGSTDSTIDLITSNIGGHPAFRLLHSPRRGKIPQLNEALSFAEGEIVVNTDVDTLLPPDSLKHIAAEFAADPRVGVVGAYCRPKPGFLMEDYYWSAQNKGRFLESDAETTSIVIAPCYAFRRELFKAFPDDVVADDIYVAFQANTLGHRVVYSRLAHAIETRTPSSLNEFLPHKFRKGNAFLRESLRFLYRLPEMSWFVKMMFLTRVAQQLLLPIGLLLWSLLAAAMGTLGRLDVVGIAALFLFASLFLTKEAFRSVALPEEVPSFPFAIIVQGYFLTFFILLVNGFSYPFFQQGSSYSRLQGSASQDKQ